MNITDKIHALSQLQSGLFQKDFLLTWEKSEKDLRILLEVAGILKEMRNQNISPRVFDSGLAILFPIFGIIPPELAFHLLRLPIY